MKLQRKLSLFTLAALLLSLLAGCHAAVPTQSAPGPDSSGRPAPTRRAGPSDSPAPSAEPSPEPTPEPDLWDPEHRLDISFTPAKGLELPISGSTGFASVKLPLWEELPQKGEGEDGRDEGKLATIYAPPEPTPEASAEPDPALSEQPQPPAPEPVPTPEEPAPTPDNPAPEGGEVEGEENSVPPLPIPQADAPSAFVEVQQPPAPAESLEVLPPPGQSADVPLPSEGFLPLPGDSGAPTAAPTAEPTPEATPEPTPEPTPTPDPMEGALAVLEPGTAFRILGESGDWWQVHAEGVTGWVEHRYCLINLPDVIPSMIYNDTNAYSSVFVSCGRDIPNITGRALYEAKADNPRLGRREFVMPVLYAMAKNVCQAQQNALAEGNTLVLYEGFRPYSAQMAVVRNLTALSKRDDVVRAGISTRPWNISWFIATGASNHQEGYAMDVSLAKVTRAHTGQIGGYSVVQIDEYEEYTMPTPIHELSMAAATYTKPVAIFSTTAWKSATLAPDMAANQPALALQRYCTSAKLTPLASEWWHFNDLAAHGQIRAFPSKGNYTTGVCLSTAP